MKDTLKGILYVALFAVPFIPLIVSDSLFFPFITGKNFTFRILVEIALAAWVLLALYDAQYRPRFSWIIAAFTGLLGVTLVSNLLGEHPYQSFWSNYERMEGYVTLLHVFAYILVLGATLKTKEAWHWFINTTLFAASILSLYAFGQLSGNFQINQGGVRVDGTLGNAAYMAVYMLFHSFFAIYMATQAKSSFARYSYVGLALVFMYLLVQTATRGTIIGLVGGLALAGLYIAIFAKDSAKLRKAALIGIVGLVVLVGGFIAARDTAFVAENQILSRVASISLKDGSTRFEIWSMALGGVAERPILGWGQGNFSYVFNKYYSPELYAQEPWFDRAHNIMMDWLVGGGVLGLIAYLSLFGAALYYIMVRPRLWGDAGFGITEQGLLLGLLGAYFVHNLFVFDNIVSYIFFGTILAFIHARVATPVVKVEKYRMPEAVINHIAVPVGAVLLIACIYVVNVPSIKAAADIIDGFQATSPEAVLAEFESALSRGGLGSQEIREQLTQRGQQILQGQVSEATREAFRTVTEAELMKQIEEKPGDARVHVFVSAFYRYFGELDKAREQLAIARSLSPQKQQIIFEQGFIEMQANDFAAAVPYFKEAFELEQRYELARVYYAAALLYAGSGEEARALLTEEYMPAFSRSDLAINAAVSAGAFDLLVPMAEFRVAEQPENLQVRVGLASVYYDAGDIQKAIGVLQQAIADFPDFKDQGEQFINDLLAGRRPGTPAAVEVNAGGVNVETVEIE